MSNCQCPCKDDRVSQSNLVVKIDELEIGGETYKTYIFADDEIHQDSMGSTILFIVSDSEADYLITMCDDEQPQAHEEDEECKLVFGIRSDYHLTDAKANDVNIVIGRIVNNLLEKVLPEMQKEQE